MVIKTLLSLKKKMRSVKPKFRRQEAHRRKRIARSGWRRPKGVQSKLRRYHKSKGERVRVGYRTPREVRGVLANGKKPMVVNNVAEMEALDTKTYVAILSSRVGMRKRVELVKLAIKKGIEILNVDVKTYDADVKKKLAARKEKRKARIAKRTKKAKKDNKKAKKTEKLESKVSETEKTDIKKDMKDTESASKKDDKPIKSEPKKEVKAKPLADKPVAKPTRKTEAKTKAKPKTVKGGSKK